MITSLLHRFARRRLLAPLASVLFLFAAAQSTSAAIAFDAAATKTVTNAASASWSHTVGSGSDRVLIVGLTLEDTSTSVLNVSAITCNGTAMTAVSGGVGTAGSSTFDRAQLYYVLNPASGANTISVTFGGAVNGVSIGSI